MHSLGPAALILLNSLVSTPTDCHPSLIAASPSTMVIVEVATRECLGRVLPQFSRVTRVIQLAGETALVAGQVKSEVVAELERHECVITFAPEGRLRYVR